VTAGAEYDALGFGFDELSPEDRRAVIAAYPRIDFTEAIIRRSPTSPARRSGRRTPPCRREAAPVRAPEGLRDDSPL
jgi:hypothetical protein